MGKTKRTQTVRDGNFSYSTDRPGQPKDYVDITPSKKFPLLIRPFIYNGFMGRLVDERPIVRARYVRMTNDPGIVKVELETEELLYVPTFAFTSESLRLLPPYKWDNCFTKSSKSILFGIPSKLL